jgi:hypothetical protein
MFCTAGTPLGIAEGVGPLRRSVTTAGLPMFTRAAWEDATALRNEISTLGGIPDGKLKSVLWLTRHLAVSTRAVNVILSLPTIKITVSDTPGGRAIWQASLTTLGPTPSLRGVAKTAYSVPEDGKPFPGRRAHGRRSAVNQARSAGLTTTTVTVAESEAFLSRISSTPLACSDCNGPVYLCCSPMGDPLAVTHVHLDNDVAQMAVAVHEESTLSGLARYAIFSHMVQDLADRRVKLLFVHHSFLLASPGLLEFSQLLGFIPVNLRIVRATKRDVAATRRGQIAVLHRGWRRDRTHSGTTPGPPT